MADASLEIVGHQFRHDTVKVAEQPDMAGQPVLGGPGRFGIEVAGERQAADKDAGLAWSLGRADGQRHAGIIDLAGRPRSMLAPHPRFGAGAGHFTDADMIRFEQVNREILDDDLAEMLRNNPPDVVYNAFSQAFFQGAIRM